eukprot:CAMPEP_0113969830 /NCGR_PEP_ID=MMETSP0011_2-20120614/10625_1 /TAXON_ID=101924 /ORGANISM="Rhodosorus marinus" /LENGTH=105 /DNA_ID=CAMNT_0000983711 /DNA_START=163 /DNA_END=477 /DNA_ORIENTATION=+ /assembly_acc=CAM_ASM_000156
MRGAAPDSTLKRLTLNEASARPIGLGRNTSIRLRSGQAREASHQGIRTDKCFNARVAEMIRRAASWAISRGTATVSPETAAVTSVKTSPGGRVFLIVQLGPELLL